jgi:hypothetical protein
MNKSLFNYNIEKIKNDTKNIISIKNIENFKFNLKETLIKIKEKLKENTNINTIKYSIRYNINANIKKIKKSLNKKDYEIYKPYLKNIIKLYIYIIKLASLSILKKNIKIEINKLNNDELINKLFETETYNIKKINESISKNNNLIKNTQKKNINFFKLNNENNINIINLLTNVNLSKTELKNNNKIIINKNKIIKELTKGLIRKKIKYSKKIKKIIIENIEKLKENDIFKSLFNKIL